MFTNFTADSFLYIINIYATLCRQCSDMPPFALQKAINHNTKCRLLEAKRRHFGMRFVSCCMSADY